MIYLHEIKVVKKLHNMQSVMRSIFEDPTYRSLDNFV